MSSCPNCGKPVDSLRSRNVSVRAGKVVAYCSAACQAAQETKPTAVPKRAMPTAESGPVIEIIHEPASGVVTSAPDRRDASSPAVSTPSSSASGTSKKKKSSRGSQPVLPVAEPAAPEPAPKKRASSEPANEWAKNAEMIEQDAASRVEKPRRGLITALFIVVVAGVAAFVAYKFIFVKKATSATTTPAVPVAKVEPTAPVPPPVATPPAPPAASISVPEALDRAKVAIAKNLRAESPRVQRLAAAALERGGDRAASEVLAAALKNETNDIARLELAYQLARGGDQRGANALNQALLSSNRDTQRWAAERIVRLAIGADPKRDVSKAADVLAASLEVPQNRLLSGELLARVDDLRGAIAIERIRTDAATTPEVKAEAAIALGLSGHADIAPTLHELLANGSVRARAAAALAHLHDATARAVLVEQLAIATQRVRAARALRELEPALDPIPLVLPLLDALGTAKDAEQVEVGEAVLVLCGPAAWSTAE